MQGLILGLKFGPRDQNLSSYTIPITILAGATRVVNFYAEFHGIARSIEVINRDAANTALVILNNDRINTFTIATSQQQGFNDQWCEQIEITAGAAGAVNLFIELVPNKDLGLE